MRMYILSSSSVFLSTPSARRATKCSAQEGTCQMGFLSTPSARRATPLIKSVIWAVVFLSTPSARRATLHPIYLNFPFQFLSTPSARRATAAYTDNIAVLFISIHALREEGDSPVFCGLGSALVFLSTPSARRATIDVHVTVIHH